MAFLQPSKSILRQVDLIIASLVEYPTAVLGWTGSRQFERALRDYAKRVCIVYLCYPLFS